MKNKQNTVAVVCIIVLLGSFIVIISSGIMLMFSLFGGLPQTAITAEAFMQTAKAENFAVSDMTDEIDTQGVAASVLVAYGENYNIEFYVTADEENGESMFYHSKKLLDDEHPFKAISSEAAFKQYNYYAFTADGGFYMISRIGNTMIRCEADQEYRKEIIEIAEKLGYK